MQVSTFHFPFFALLITTIALPHPINPGRESIGKPSHEAPTQGRDPIFPLSLHLLHDPMLGAVGGTGILSSIALLAQEGDDVEKCLHMDKVSSCSVPSSRADSEELTICINYKQGLPGFIPLWEDRLSHCCDRAGFSLQLCQTLFASSIGSAKSHAVSSEDYRPKTASGPTEKDAKHWEFGQKLSFAGSPPSFLDPVHNVGRKLLSGMAVGTTAAAVLASFGSDGMPGLGFGHSRR